MCAGEAGRILFHYADSKIRVFKAERIVGCVGVGRGCQYIKEVNIHVEAGQGRLR